jgi:transketolase
MRKHFSNYIEQLADKHDDIVFITGDLGYNALENLRAKMGGRFVNAGVAEQSMISIAAGMASQGYRVVCYSIAPFVVYRCLEQIRNDVCFHNLPVYIVGNGGGYGYGVLGSSHHALEDLATLSGLPNMRCFVPAFIDDMNVCLDEMFARKAPAYLRLGPGKNIPADFSIKDFGVAGAKNEKAELTIITQCPVTNNLVAALADNAHAGKVEVFAINKMPLTSLPASVKESIARTKKVLTIEEHISIGGIGSAISYLANEESLPINKFVSLHAEGYPNGLYGNQNYHQEQSGLDAGNISKVINAYF